MAAESSPLLDRRTTKSRAVIFGGLRSVGHARAAELLGISESTFSEWLSKNGDRVAQLLTAAGMKPVPLTWKCVDPDEYAQLKRWAVQRLEMRGEEGETGLHWETP